MLIIFKEKKTKKNYLRFSSKANQILDNKKEGNLIKKLIKIDVFVSDIRKYQVSLKQGWATLFVRGPYCVIVCASRAGQKDQIQAKTLPFAGRMRTAIHLLLRSMTKNLPLMTSHISSVFFTANPFLKTMHTSVTNS